MVVKLAHMIIGILSDTHGLLRPEVMAALSGCEAILHGGDINRQAIIDELERIAPVYAVRGSIDGACDGCSPGLIEMYQDYIEGRRELREINMAFNARYTSGRMGPERGGCEYGKQ